MKKTIMTHPKKKNIAAQGISEELWELAHNFLDQMPTMHSRGDLAKIAIESYIAQAVEFGVDGNWRPRIPGVQTEIYKNAYKKLRVGERNEQEQEDNETWEATRWSL